MIRSREPRPRPVAVAAVELCQKKKIVLVEKKMSNHSTSSKTRARSARSQPPTATSVVKRHSETVSFPPPTLPPSHTRTPRTQKRAPTHALDSIRKKKTNFGTQTTNQITPIIMPPSPVREVASSVGRVYGVCTRGGDVCVWQDREGGHVRARERRHSTDEASTPHA